MVLGTTTEATDWGSGYCKFEQSPTQDPTLIFLCFLIKKDRKYINIMSWRLKLKKKI